MMNKPLYERLGGSKGITQIANDLVDIHIANPIIAARFVNSDVDKMKKAAAAFFITGSGGPAVYEGKDMLQTHKGMNISPHEFLSTLDDVLKALQKNNISQREQEEVLFILYNMKSDIVFV